MRPNGLSVWLMKPVRGWPLGERRCRRGREHATTATPRSSPFIVACISEGERMAKKPGEILDLIKKQGVKMVDVRFTDVPGTWQHNSVPANMVDEEALVDG